MKHIKRGLLALLCLVMLLPYTTGLAEETITATARVYSLRNIAWPIAFSDAYLAGDSKDYRQDLARASLGMALSAFRVTGAAGEARADNIKRYFTEMGFRDISLQQFEVEPTDQTIASAIAQKAMSDAEGPFLALAVAVSGGGYKDEWQSNFKMGAGLHHEGFDRAAQQVMNHLKDYQNLYGLKGRIKVWVSGFSRAAATSNRLGALLLDREAIAPKNLFVYTFATPNVTKLNNAEGYPSIFNIVGSFDPVTQVPFYDWGYRRYGQTYFLPAPEINSDYSSRAKPVSDLFESMTGQKFFTNQSSKRALQETLGVMSTSITSSDGYVKGFQSLLINLWKVRKNPLGMLVQTVREAAANNTLWNQMQNMAGSAFTILGNSMGESAMQQAGVLQNEWGKGTSLLENLVYEHYPAGYLSWMMAYDSLDALKSPNRAFRQVHLGADVTISVFDPSGLRVVDSRLQDATGQTGQSLLPVTQVGDGLLITLPADQEYQLELTALSNKPLDLIIKEGIAGQTRLSSFVAQDVPLEEGRSYRLTLPKAFSKNGYEITYPGGKADIKPVERGALINRLESNSEFMRLLSQNGLVLIASLVFILLQLLFYLFLAIRSLRRLLSFNKRRKQRKAQGKRQPALRFRLQKGQKSRNAIKLLSYFLLPASLALLAVSVLAALDLLSSIGDLSTLQMMWYSFAAGSSVIILLFLFTVPAIGAAVFGLLWPREDCYTLRTSQLFALCAMLFVPALSFSLYFQDHVLGHRAWLRVVMPLSMLSVIALFFLAMRWIRKTRKAQRCHQPPQKTLAQSMLEEREKASGTISL